MGQPQIVGRAVEDFNRWVNEIDNALGLNDATTAYAVMRGVLHQVRDRMPPSEAVHLGAQLPTLVRGVYYETFTLSGVPETERNAETFLVRVAERIAHDDVDPQAALRAVYGVLKSHVTAGQIGDVVHMMPDDIKLILGEPAESPNR